MRNLCQYLSKGTCNIFSSVKALMLKFSCQNHSLSAKENLAGAEPLGEARLPSCPYASNKVYFLTVGRTRSSLTAESHDFDSSRLLKSTKKYNTAI
jgi:hypothetical protein